jgi:hypothetical protein
MTLSLPSLPPPLRPGVSMTSGQTADTLTPRPNDGVLGRSLRGEPLSSRH